MSTIIKSVLSILFISQTIQARSFNPCELENELLNIYNLTTDESRNLTCVAQKYSQLTTNIINNGSKTVYYGIFQIGQKYCGIDKAGGKCNIKCSDLVDDDITDDIKCAQKLFQKLGTKAWKLNKNPGCKKEFNYLDENCHKNANIDDTFQVQPDFCELARKLMTEYDISKIDATKWSCISEYSKTGNLNLRSGIEKEDENRRVDEEPCVKARDVECALKNNKLSGFKNWPAYELYCKNITESTCFQGTNTVNRSDIIEQIKNVQNTETSKQPKIFTTSTEISVFIEDDNGNLTEYSDITTESPKVSQQTTEFLSDTIEKPSYDDQATIEGYSKVRIMSADKKIVEYSETHETTSKSIDEITQINSSLAKSTTDSISAELSHTKHTTEEINVKYYETIDKCALAKSMSDSGRFPKNLISTFLCIAEHESDLNVSLIDSDGQQSRYGLFQIDNQIYCSSSDNFNQCHVLCTQLVDDQFDNDFKCVHHIYKKEGFNYWPSYEKSCKNINSNSLDYCFEAFTTSQRPSTVLNIEEEYHTTVGTTEATINDLSHKKMEMTTLINGTDLALSDGSLDFCEFSHQLKVNLSIGIWEDLVHYACIADQISHLRPKLVNDDRLGIFSLKDNTCGKYEAGGLCSILCSSLLNDDLIDDAECMIKVYKESGLKEWNISIDSCKAYTPKILRCIDEGKFSIPSDGEIDVTEDQSIEPDSKDDKIQKHVADYLEMTLSKANTVTEIVDSLEDLKKFDQSTLSSVEATSSKEDTTIEFEILTTAKVLVQDQETLEIEEQITTEAQKSFDTTEKYLEEEEPKIAMKSLLDTTTSDELESESTTFEPKNNETDQTTSTKYDDDESNDNEDVEINLLTTTIRSLLDTEIERNYLDLKEDNEPETTDKIDVTTQETLTIVEMDDETNRTVDIADIEGTTTSMSESEATTNKSELKNLEKNRKEKNETFDNEPEVLETSEQESPEATTKSILQITNEEFKALIDDITKTLINQIIENKNYSGLESTKLGNPITEEYKITESESENLKSSQTTEMYDIIDYDIVPKIWARIFSEKDEKSVHEETTSEIPLNFDDKTEIIEPEILSSENFLEATEKSTGEETKANIEPISTEASFSQGDNHTLNIEKIIELETTTENGAIKHIEDQLYLKSTTESSFTRNILDTDKTTQKLMTQLDKDVNEEPTESEKQDETVPEKSTIATTSFNEESDVKVTTEESQLKPTTENLYYTSIREIIEEYQKSSITYLDNTQTKRNQYDFDEETTLDDFLDDYNGFVDDQESTKQFIESLNKLTTLPVTPHSVNIPKSQRINKCELARYMNSSGFPENLIPTFICISEHESELNPHAVKISKSHNKYGLFQIDDNIYCSTDEKINECKISCALLADNQYDNDFECVRHIYKKEGFNYWPSYEKSCKNVDSNELNYCYDKFKSESDENKEFNNFQQTTLEMSQIEDISVTTDSHILNLKDNESKSIIRKFDLCELTRELYSRNISMNDIPQYLCIADIKSQLEIKKPNQNEQSFGLFSISSEFCGQNESSGICSMKCSKLWDSDIFDDVDCVYKIIQTNGTDKWDLNSEACQIYDNKILECFDKTTEHPKIEVDDVKRNASVLQHDVIADKNLEDLRQETINLRSSNLDIESDEMTTEETTIPIEQTTSKILQILTSTAATDNDDSATTDKQTNRAPIININLPHDLLTDQNLSKQVNTLIKNFTYYDVLPKNGSIIFNIFNFNIYGKDHDIKLTLNRGTELRDETDD